MKKPVKQMTKKDFNQMNMILSGSSGMNDSDKRFQYDYWRKRVLDRIDYLYPLIDECKVKDIDLRTLSLELSNEWVELHDCVDFYKF